MSFNSSSSKCLRSDDECKDTQESSKLGEECAKEDVAVLPVSFVVT